MMKLLILILLATTLTSSAQIFEGKMTYSNTYQSKLPNLKSEQLNSMMGTKQEYYIKGNNYKSLFNGLFPAGARVPRVLINFNMECAQQRRAIRSHETQPHVK